MIRLNRQIAIDMDDIDHKAIIAKLSAGERTELTGRTNTHGLLRLAVHGGLVVLLGSAVAFGVPYWQLLVLPQGVLIVFLFTLLHETSHDTVFRSRWLNRAVGTVCGFLNFIPATWFRFFHFAHHRFTHDPQRDPELASPKPVTVWQYAKYLSGIPFWASMVKVLIENSLGPNRDEFVPDRARRKVVLESRWHMVAYSSFLAGSLLVGTDVLLWAWIIPVLVGQPFLRAYLLAEHALCPHVANMLENTRTTFTNRFIRFFAWNMPYHAEHHAYPAVPFHKLPRFHRHVRDYLAVTERGYARFHRRLLASLE